MGFFETLNQNTKTEQEQLFQIPFVVHALEGDISLDTYVAFLTQAYHHVKHTVPLLEATHAAVSTQCEWLRSALETYMEEESGHDEWILGDISECGADAETVRHGTPDRPCELMVAYAYDVVNRRNPLGFFGMVHVLEGTSARGATRAAERIQARLDLPKRAFTYLTTHGDLDQDHVAFFRGLMDRVEDPADQQWIIHTAKMFFQLYGDIFRSLEMKS